MRVIDWERILRDNRIPYIESGPNVKRGEMAIRCPFCGSADPSMHMGLSRETGWWSCWRNRAQHSGKSPLRLLMKLLGIPYAAAREIAGLGDDYVDPEGFDAMAAKLMGRDQNTGRPEELERRVLKLDDAFRPIAQRGRTARHFDYLVDARGFYAKDVEALGRQYGICAGVSNEYQDRVVMPYYQDGDLMTWTARAIGPSKIRYRDLEIDDSILPPKKTLFNHDSMLGGGKILVLQEGPMDALKVDFYGRPYGIRSVALSTNSIQTDQAFLLQTAVGRFEQTMVMLDNASILGLVDSMRMRQELAFLPNVVSATVPFGAKDGADLTPAQIRRWAKDLASEL